MCTIWVVDDDPDFLRLARYRILKAIPDASIVEIDAASDAVERIVAGERPDLVVSDLIFRSAASGVDVVSAARARGIRSVLCSDVHPRWGPPGMVRKVSLLENVSAILGGLALCAV